MFGSVGLWMGVWVGLGWLACVLINRLNIMSHMTHYNITQFVQLMIVQLI